MAVMIKVPTIKKGWEILVKRIVANGVELKDEITNCVPAYVSIVHGPELLTVEYSH